MTALREAAQMALDALEHGLPIIEDFGAKEQLQIQHKAIAALYEALRAALVQPEPSASVEPVAWMCPHDPERETAFSWQSGMCESSGCGHQRVPLYTAPPQREWQGLRGEQIYEVTKSIVPKTLGFIDVPEWVIPFARAIEAKLKEKNNAT